MQFRVLLFFLSLPFMMRSQDNCLKSLSAPRTVNEYSETETSVLLSTNRGFFVADKGSHQIIARYDQINMGMPCFEVQSAAGDGAGGYWVITCNQLVQIVNGQVIPRPDLSRQLASKEGNLPDIKRIFYIDGEVYITTAPFGLFKISGNKVKPIKSDQPKLYTKNIWHYRDTIFVGTNHGLAYLKRNKLRLPKASGSLSLLRCEHLTLASDLHFWSKAGRLGVVEYKGSKHNRSTHTLYDINHKNPIRYEVDQVFSDQQGQVYAVAEGSVYQYLDKKWEIIAFSPVNQPIRSGFVDASGQIWAFGQRFGGLKVWESGVWKSVQLPGLDPVSPTVRQFTPSGKDFLIATSSQAYHYNNKTAKPLLKKTFVTAVGNLFPLDQDRAIQIARHSHYGFKFRQIKSRTGQILSEKSHEESNYRFGGAAFIRDTFFMITNGVEYTFNLSNNKRKKYSQGLPKKIKGARWASDGTAWAWTINSLYTRKPGGQWKAFIDQDDVIRMGKKIWALELTPEGRPMIFCGFRFYVLSEDNHFELVSKLPVKTVGCSDPFYMSVVDTSHFWVGRRYHLFEYRDGKWEKHLKEKLFDRFAWMTALHYDEPNERLFIGTNNEFFEYDLRCAAESGQTAPQDNTPSFAQPIAGLKPPPERPEIYLNCYPNPFSAQVQFSFKSSSSSSFTAGVYDSAGRLLFIQSFKPNIGNIALPFTQKLAAGTYYLQCIQDQHSVIRKIIKVRE